MSGWNASGKLEKTGVRFTDDHHLRRIINKIVAQVGRRVDEASPMVDARLPDGSRVNAVCRHCRSRAAAHDPQFRKSAGPERPRRHRFAADAGQRIPRGVDDRTNILVSGGTGSGKTTLLNALSGCMPETSASSRSRTRPSCGSARPTWCGWKPPAENVEGQGEMTIRDLVRNALRMRPDRIIIGEVRGSEALDMLQAMNTGHDGSLTTCTPTLHATPSPGSRAWP